MSEFKYFGDWEIVGLARDLVFKLDRMRGLLNKPIRLTETVATGGSHVPNSAHEKGLAADGTIRAVTDKTPYTLEEQLEIAWAAGRAGFSRVGIYDRHFHVDIDDSKPTPAIWTGESK